MVSGLQQKYHFVRSIKMPPTIMFATKNIVFNEKVLYKDQL
jgi:hypothetical protein